MRKPVEQPQRPHTPVCVKTISLVERGDVRPLMVYTAKLPQNYKVLDASWFKNKDHGAELTLRVRCSGENAFLAARFLVVTPTPDQKTDLPRVVTQLRDPPDSPELQWSFWQSLRVGGALYHDVFDVTHLELEGFPSHL